MKRLCSAPNPADLTLTDEQIPSRQEMMEYFMGEVHEALFQYSVFANLSEEQSRAYIQKSMNLNTERTPEV